VQGLRERAQQARLADAGLAFDEHQPARARARLDPLRPQLREQGFAFEQRHRCGSYGNAHAPHGAAVTRHRRARTRGAFVLCKRGQ
jgi:hypothetical protein